MVPVAFDPHGSGTGAGFVMTPNPNPTVMRPNPVAIDPDVSRAGRNADDFTPRLRWPFSADNNLPGGRTFDAFVHDDPMNAPATEGGRCKNHRQNFEYFPFHTFDPSSPRFNHLAF